MDAIERYRAQSKLEEEADRLNQKDDYASHLSHLNDMMDTGHLKIDSYYREFIKANKEGGQTLGNITVALQNAADTGAEMFAKWATGMDSSAIHWSSMIRSMMTDWAKLEAQVGERALLSFFNSELASWFGGSGGTSSLSWAA